jgi:hypothetical protein
MWAAKMMTSANKLILVGVVLVVATWFCDVTVRQLYPTFVNGDIGHSVLFLMLFPMLGHFIHFSGHVWKVVRVITVLLAVPMGLWIAPPMMDTPAAGEWNIPLGVLQCAFLFTSFTVAFLLIHVEATKTKDKNIAD